MNNSISKKINFYSSIGLRASYGMILYELVKHDKNIFVLSSDTSTSAGLDRLRKDYKNNYVEVGISEQNLIGVASGIANEGYTVYTSTFAPFQTLRCLEQIKVNLGYMGLKICMTGLASGLALGNLGYTHCSIEEIGALRSIPNITILQPCDGFELEKCIKEFKNSKNSFYIRLTGNAPIQKTYVKNYNFKVGEPVEINKGKKVVFFSSGTILSEVIKVKEYLLLKGINPSIINIHSLKPINKKKIIEICKNHEFVFTVEEHNIFGGLGSIISEIISENNLNVKFNRFGVNDKYSRSGSYDFLKKIHFLSAEKIIYKLNTFLKQISF